jgi:hypothetical protein
MKRKSFILVILLVLLGFFGFLATNLVRNSGKSDTELLNFSIKDTSSIDKIIITEPNGDVFEMLRNGKKWTDKNGQCIVQQPVGYILETIKNIEFKGYVPEASREQLTKRMAANHVKVEIFQYGKWEKTWFIGSSTPDHYGTYMLLENRREKSDLPVIMKVKGLHGIIGPRFFSDARRWKCTNIFELERDQIALVDVKYTENPERNFTVTKNGSNYGVSQNGKALPIVDTNMIVRYLNNYKKIHFEFANFELNEKQVDSLKNKTKPFAELTVKQTSGISETIKCYRLKGNGDVEVDDFGDSITYDANRFWALLPSGEIVKCQYFVFNPLLMGHIYFALKQEAVQPVVEDKKKKKK